MSRRTRVIVLALVAVLAVVVVGPWVYFNVIRDDPPDRLTLDDATASTEAEASPSTTGAPADPDDGEGISGGWMVGPGSQAGYRAREVLFGQDAEAVGRTTEVSGSMEIVGTTVEAVEIVVDMASVTSDESMRDGQFRGRIMSTSEFPTASFELTRPVELGIVPADGVEVTHPVAGDLTLRGVTREVTFELTARRNGATIEANGTIAVSFDDFEIPDASGGPAQVGRDGEVELLMVFHRP